MYKRQAIGRTASDVYKAAKTKPGYFHKDGAYDTTKTPLKIPANAGDVLREAWADGFTPNALKDYLKNTNYLPGMRPDLEEIADKIAKHAKPGEFKGAIRRGMDIVRKYPGRYSTITGISALSGLGDWTYFLIGLGVDVGKYLVNKAKEFKNPKDIQTWTYLEPPGWGKFKKSMGVTTGRGLQRGARIGQFKQEEENERQQEVIRGYRGGLRQ